MKLPFVKSRIGIRFSIYAALLSLLVGILSMLLIYFVELKQDKEELKTRAVELIHTVKPQLIKSLWDFNEQSTALLLTSLEESLLFSSVSITDQLNQNTSVGDIVIHLSHDDIHLGYILADFNYPAINAITLNQIKSTAYVLFGVVSLIGLLIYILVNQSLIKHIIEIGKPEHNQYYDSSDDFEPVVLKRKNYDDELDQLVNRLNSGRKQSVELFREKKRYQKQIEFQANNDLLTGLPNRRYLDGYLSLQIKNYKYSLGHLVVLFIDLDGFKNVNDSFGHEVGDMVLKESAKRIKNIIDVKEGVVARLGGDEFIACFYDDNIKQGDIVSRKIIDSFGDKLKCQDLLVRLSCSIGITAYPDHQVENSSQLIRNADKALYKAKDSGKNTFYRFDNKMLEDYFFKQKIADKLPHAIENGLFEIHLQPLIDIQKAEVIGFEALVRWTDKELGFIRPDIFIAIAEKMGCVFEIDIYVFKQAMQQVEILRKDYNRDFILSVNFSPTNFYHVGFFDWVRNGLTSLDNNMDWLELEVTERLMLSSDPIVFEGIRKLREKGIRFSIDDFGIGYSSLGYIKKFSGIFSKIKIDRLFINEILTGGFDFAFVKSIMMLADSLNMIVLAEGVEEKEQVDMLNTLGCQYVQGYYFSKPLPFDKLVEFLDKKYTQDLAASNLKSISHSNSGANKSI